MLEDDGLVSREQALLGGDIDMMVGVPLIEVVDRDAGDRSGSLHEGAIHARVLRRGVDEQDQNPRVRRRTSGRRKSRSSTVRNAVRHRDSCS
jgi:hypothetical protein